ncbi:MAG TPA: 3'-5' exonuclease [Flavipsychrobacter sp.]|nr:3'-5' exonuclease [Flavipsychrobacter sp.]
MEQLKHILFIDIETVSGVPDFSLLKEGLQTEWIRKSKYVKSAKEGNTDPASLFIEKSAIFSEFAKVVCIGFGSFHLHENGWRLRLKTLKNDNEKNLLNDFCEVLTRFNNHYPNLRFCGHNIKEFDVPFLCRRMIINGIGLPECMKLNNKKPWEVPHIDTLELWRFGDYKHYTSLALLAEVLGIPSPKNDIDGSMVGTVYWKYGDLQRIAKYCLQDVLTTAKVFLKLTGINEEIQEPIYVDDEL